MRYNDTVSYGIKLGSQVSLNNVIDEYELEFCLILFDKYYIIVTCTNNNTRHNVSYRRGCQLAYLYRSTVGEGNPLREYKCSFQSHKVT